MALTPIGNDESGASNDLFGGSLFKMIVRRAVESKMKKWIEDSRSVSVFVTGKTGTGKSSLVNGILGQEVAVEGDTLDPSTSKVSNYQFMVDGIQINVWDSPGLQDGTQNEKEYIEDIKQKCSLNDVHLYIYCIRMSESRFVKDNRDIRAMHILNDSLGMGMWMNTIFVLSFANDIIDTGEDELGLSGKELEVHFNAKLTEWTKRLRQTLEDDLGLPDYIAQRVKVIPAGYRTSPQLIENSGDYWLSQLWMAALHAAKSEAQPALIKINEHRLKKLEEIGQQSIEKELLIAQPIIFADKGAELGAQHGMPQLGALEGFNTGLDLSVQLLLELGLENKFIMGEDIAMRQADGHPGNNDTGEEDFEKKGC